MALLEVNGLVKIYGKRRVVDGVDFKVDAGEIVGLLGPNGAGKTTSFKMTTGQVEPYAGHVHFNGQDVARLPMYKRARLGMGYLSQETSVFRRISVEQNILAILEMLPQARTLGRKLTRHERWDRTDTILEQFGLLHVRKNNAARLSGGEKRRLEIARCLVCEPLLILLDEPFTGIDPKTIHDIQKIVMDLRKSGIGVLLTDHNVREALKITTRSYLIKDGKVRTHGTPYQLVHDQVAIDSYLGDGFNDNSFMEKPDGHVEKPEVKVEKREEPEIVQPVLAPRPVAPAPPSAADSAVEQVKILRLVEGLKGTDPEQAASSLVRKGFDAIPELLNALQQRDLDIRRQALLVLQKILKKPVMFDPYAQETVRRQQLAALRDQFERKAG